MDKFKKISLLLGTYVALLIVIFSLIKFGAGYFALFLGVLFMYLAYSLSWNVVAGIGYVSLGHQALFGIGAYTMAVLIMKFGMSPYISVPLAGLVSMAPASFIAFVSMRLKGPYFAICTLAFTSAVMYWVINNEYLGGARGIFYPPEYHLVEFYIGMLTIFFIMIIVAYLFKSGRIGLALSAIREDEEAAECMGINTLKFKVMTFVVCGMVPAMCGALYGWYLTYFDPPTVFDTSMQLTAMAIAVFGGIGTITGVISGGIILLITMEILWSTYPSLYLIILAIILICVITLMPQGVIPYLLNKLKPIFKR